jgi:hypothetical protein
MQGNGQEDVSIMMGRGRLATIGLSTRDEKSRWETSGALVWLIR